MPIIIGLKNNKKITNPCSSKSLVSIQGQKSNSTQKAKYSFT